MSVTLNIHTLSKLGEIGHILRQDGYYHTDDNNYLKGLAWFSLRKR
jgi:hypothetical protein